MSSVKSSSGSTRGLYNVPGSGVTWHTRAAATACTEIETEEILRTDSYDVSWVNALRVTKSVFVDSTTIATELTGTIVMTFTVRSEVGAAVQL